MLEIEVRDFGPIETGRVRLKPLTVFVGPNNSGKSYLAMLLYALHMAANRVYGPTRSERSYGLDSFFLERTEDKGEWALDVDEASTICVHELPHEELSAVRDAVRLYFDLLRGALGKELERCFGAKLPNLSRRAPAVTHFVLTLSHSDPLWSLKALQASGDVLHSGEPTFDVGSINIDVSRFFVSEAEAMLPPPLIGAGVLAQVVESIARGLPNAYYFPAARSGILHSHKALASFLVRQSPLVGLERIDIPKLSGVITDFVGELLTIEKRKPVAPIAEIAAYLEGNVLHGDVSLDTGETQYPEIFYKAESGRFPLHRTSSMVSELAPIVLFLKHKIQPGNLLIIEEPESHLHPASQLRLAKALAQLVKAKVNVLLTTHSDYFLTQISNFIRAAKAPTPAPSDLPTLGAEEVAAYLFKANENGTEVRELSVTEADGIPDDDFAQVSEALYQERIDLQT